jgi:hypothetical protein
MLKLTEAIQNYGQTVEPYVFIQYRVRGVIKTYQEIQNSMFMQCYSITFFDCQLKMYKQPSEIF